MADLLAQLQAALADRYKIERELGRGGMATVYLAHDRKHHRPVAIKVLKPELAAALGPDRFLREIEIAAGLTHPHILTLYDSGDAGGLLYYVMPYVEGETLRDRLNRERQLPVEDALRIACEVADALSYAHSHDVVHRDIKPENILFQAGHAVVSDFGIARAITAAAGGNLTATGIAIGTPAYMSPEQASGEPRIDGRADTYSLGCVVYEMLAGHPPFTGATAQEILARHSMDAVPLLRAARQAVPETVQAAIARALGKTPADRFATAAQFAEALSRGADGALVAHLSRTAVLFVFASLALLAGVYGLMLTLGLPEWVFAGAIALLLLGLPVVAVTALVEGRRAQARTSTRPAPSSGGLRAWLTWRRATLGGVFAFSGLALVTMAYMAMRLLGIGPVGTLVASGVIKNREPLILADFENRSGDSTLAASLTAAFRVDLSQSPTVRLMDAATIAAALRRMERPLTTPLDAALARELAQRENVKAVVQGEIDPLGTGYVLSASLIAAADGHVLTALRETANNNAALIGALDRLSRKLRERIGESLKSIRASEPLEQVTTGSLDALRKYSEAARAESEGDYERAAAGYREATAIDTGFAMAYRKISVVLAGTRASHSAVAAAATQAFRRRDRLPEIENYLSTGWYYETVDWNWRKAISAYRSVLDRDPENKIALENLPGLLTVGQQWREAETLAVRAADLGVDTLALTTAALDQMSQGRYSDAEATMDRVARMAPHSPDILLARFALEASHGDYSAAEQDLLRVRGEQRRSATWQAEASSWLAWLDEVRGKLAQATHHLDEFMATSEQRGLPRDYLAGAIWRGLLDVRYRHRPVAGLKAVAAALRHHPLESLPPLDRPYLALAEFYAEAGRPELARRLLDDYDKRVPGPMWGVPERLAVPGAIALAEGRAREAVLAYRAWTEHDETPMPTEGLFELATAYERAGQPDSALAVYERSVSTPGLRTPVWISVENYVGEAHGLAPTLKRLGELYEAHGDRAKAREYFGRFVDLWKDADPEFQSVVRGVRGRLARLSGEP